MCGRFSLAVSKEKIKEQFGIETDQELELSFNIAPTHEAYIIANDHPNQLQKFSWGLVPYWSNDGKNKGKLINARGESIASKPSFRIPIRQKRCLVLADSFYEWKKDGGRKIPYRIKLKDDKILAMAGIWDEWSDGENPIKTFSVITTTANQDVSQLHLRMPVIFTESSDQRKWLQKIPLDEALNMLQPLPDQQLEIYRVAEKINSPNFNSRELHQLVPEPPTLF